ncbi:hypothetical protein QVD17_36950 [Tagetes erecta]|uniref:F-box protein n=1 Tax=Tagetes erecta TaxID=13708 RepID=A0AAD8JV53_TARER|nr:hypothetical protein QVD17_36950 [Tagetes erecta]
MDLSDSSYDFLCSEVSDTLVLSEDEAFNSISVSEMKSVSSGSEKGDMKMKGETHSDASEDGNAYESDHTGDMGFVTETNYDSKVQPVPYRVNKGKKRDLMTMLSENPNLVLTEFPAQFKLKDDIKEVAKNHITRYLPAKSLFKCRQVSKEWNIWLSSPFFAHMQSQHFKKTSGFFQNSKSLAATRFISLEDPAYGVPYPSLGFLPEHVSVKSSCNGLLLCQSGLYDDEYYVCNPANMQWIKLPPSTSYHGANPKMVLAFEPSPLNFEPRYQVICLFSVSYPDVAPVRHFDIYDSITKSWSVSDMICVDLESEVKGDGIFVNGVCYWETNGGELLAYDLKNDIYSVQKLPFSEGSALSNIDGELCFVTAAYDHATKSCVLDVYGDGVMSLKKTITVPVVHIEDGEFVECTVVGNSCDDVVGLVVKGSQWQKRLYLYHHRERNVQGLGVFSHSKKLVPYVNSLVSINA